MDRVIYTAMTGANASANRQAVLSNNLANVSTNGFRAEMSTFRAVPVRGDGLPTRVMSVEATASFLDTPGTPQRSDRGLDAMATGKAWFAVQGLDGTEAYTRNGSFDVAPDGTLRTHNGLTALSDGGAPITAPVNAKVSLGFDGTLTAKTGNQPPTTIGRLKMVTPTAEDPLKRSEDSLFRSTSGEPLTSDPTARLQTGVLEGSNVNAIETMVGMIQTARQFETQTKLMQTAEANDRAAAKLLSTQG